MTFPKNKKQKNLREVIGPKKKIASYYPLFMNKSKKSKKGEGNLKLNKELNF